MSTGQVVESPFDRKCVCGLQWIQLGIQNFKCLLHISDSALVSEGDERCRGLRLKTRPNRWLSCKAKSSFKVFTSEYCLVVKHVGLADGFVLLQLFLNQTKCFSAITSA